MGLFCTCRTHLYGTILFFISFWLMGCTLSASLTSEGVFSSPQDIQIVEQAGTQSFSKLDSFKKFKLISQKPIEASTLDASDLIQSGTAKGLVIVVEPSDSPLEYDVFVSVSSQEGTVVLELQEGAVDFQDGTQNTAAQSEVSVSTFASKQSRLALGEEYLCYVDKDKKIRCQGSYYGGQTGIGDSSYGEMYTGQLVNTSLITGSGNFVKASGASYSSCALSQEGLLYCWGDNYADELGVGTGTIEVLQPTPALMTNVTGEAKFVDFAMGYESVCAISAAGDLYCSGAVSPAFLGLLTKVDLAGLGASLGKVVQVAVGEGFVCGLSEYGKVFCWGKNDLGQLGNGTLVDSALPVSPDYSGLSGVPKFIHLASGGSHVCAVAVEGQMYCWGANAHGQLGDGTKTDRSTPVLVANGALPVNEKFQAVTASHEGSCGTSAQGQIYCFGENWHFLSGNGSSAEILTPTLVDNSNLPGGVNFREVFMHEGRTCASSSENKLYCWGSPYNEASFRDHEAFAPVEISTEVLPSGQYWADVSSAELELGLLLRSSDGTAYVWGRGRPGTTDTDFVPKPLDTSTMSGSTKFKKLAMGNWAICGISNDDILHCMGNGTSVGQGGTATSQATLDPVDTTGMTGATTFADVDMGKYTACGVATDGVGYCWGGAGFSPSLYNSILGNGSSTIRYRPHPVNVTAIPGSKLFTKIVAGEYHACGLMTDQKVYCWGNSVYSRSGHSSAFSVYTPQALDTSGMTGSTLFADIHGDDESFCGISTDGITYCWGDSSGGQLGNNSLVTSNTPVPVSVAGLASAPAPLMVKSFARFSCGILDSAINIYCWGESVPAGLSPATSAVPVLINKGSMAGTPVSITGGKNLYVKTSANKIYCIGRDCNQGVERIIPTRQYFENY
ncbi:hypothetical protein Bb109J_c1728 [Bdellovibrio bacteriovorus]|nr:hypothetical protein Bb109J_c1728 [Bdellovibrio bacteriovorus]